MIHKKETWKEEKTNKKGNKKKGAETYTKAKIQGKTTSSGHKSIRAAKIST